MKFIPKTTIGSLALISSGFTMALDIDLNFYGQINQAVMHVDNGQDSRTYLTDNSNSATRLGIKPVCQLNDNYSIGAAVQYQITHNPSSKIHFDNPMNSRI